MKTAAVYIRVSTDMQVELSPDSQLKMIKQYAANNDMIITKEHIYTDDGISGRKAEKRPAFMQMIAVAKTKPKPFDVILVWKFSRFARNREDSIVYKSMLKKECGIDVISVSEPVGEDKTSILIEALLEAMDEYYSLNLAEEVRRGMTEKASRGGINGSAPFGYRIKDGIFVPDEEKAPIVKMLFEKYLSGIGTRKLATELNDMGVRTTMGNLFDNRNIEYILTNCVYTGKLRWNPTGKATASHTYKATDDTIITEGKHKPIVDNDTFEAVQKLIAENKKKYPKHYQQREREYFFRGLVRCSSCGATLTQAQKGVYLQCYKYARGQCEVSHSISVAKLREIVIETIKKNSFDKSPLNFIKVKAPNKAEEKNSFILEQIKKEEAKLVRIKEAYADGIDTLEEYKVNKGKINAAIELLKEQLMPEPVEEQEFNLDEFRKRLYSISNYLSDPDISPGEFNATLREVVSKIVFSRKEGSVEIFYRS